MRMIRLCLPSQDHPVLAIDNKYTADTLDVKWLDQKSITEIKDQVTQKNNTTKQKSQAKVTMDVVVTIVSNISSYLIEFKQNNTKEIKSEVDVDSINNGDV